MEIMTLVFLLGIVALLAGLSGKLKKSDTAKGIGLVMIVISVIVSPGILTDMISTLSAGVDIGDGGAAQDLVDKGEDATVYWSAYSGSWGGADSKTEVYPVFTIVSNGVTIVSDAAANTTTKMAVGDRATLYCTGATYYCDPVDFLVQKKTFNLNDIKAYTVIGTADAEITAYDEDGTTALTADDSSNNTADYAGGSLGAGETYMYHIKYKVAVKDEVSRLKAILTYYCGGEIDDFTLEENAWKEDDVPSGDLDTAFTHYDDINETTSCYIKHAYIPTDGNYIELQEWDYVKYQFLLDTDDSTGPSANGDSYCGAIFVDEGCEFDKSGNVVCDWYKHDDSADPDDVGLSEAVVTSGYNGLDVGVCIEPQ